MFTVLLSWHSHCETRFIWWTLMNQINVTNAEQRQVAADLWTKHINLSHGSACRLPVFMSIIDYCYLADTCSTFQRSREIWVYEVAIKWIQPAQQSHPQLTHYLTAVFCTTQSTHSPLHCYIMTAFRPRYLHFLYTDATVGQLTKPIHIFTRNI